MMNKLSLKKKILLLFAGVLSIVGIIVTIFLVQQQQDTRSRAEKSTVLTITPQKITVKPGEEAKFDVYINPGANQVNFIKGEVNYDPNVFDYTNVVFSADPASSLIPMGEVPGQQPAGSFTFSLGVGADGTRVVTTTQKIGILTFTTQKDAPKGTTQITFNESNTQVRSVKSGQDAFNENVLSSTQPASITIGEAICRPNIATCSWSPVEGATSYHYKIYTGEQAAELIVEDDTSSTSVEFQSEPGKTYSCSVVAKSVCGTGPEGSDKVTCPASPTLTPSPTPSPSATPSSTPTPTATTVPSVTIVIVQPTPQVVVSVVPGEAKGGVLVESPTPIPTLPPTGNPVVLGGLVGGFLFLLGGLALLFL